MACEISFVVVSWNARQHLHRCLSLLCQAALDSPSEVIVIDNASTDGSWQMVRDEYPEVRLLCNESNAGFAMANNQGIAVSSGIYVCLINSDS